MAQSQKARTAGHTPRHGTPAASTHARSSGLAPSCCCSILPGPHKPLAGRLPTAAGRCQAPRRPPVGRRCQGWGGPARRARQHFKDEWGGAAALRCAALRQREGRANACRCDDQHGSKAAHALEACAWRRCARPQACMASPPQQAYAHPGSVASWPAQRPAAGRRGWTAAAPSRSLRPSCCAMPPSAAPQRCRRGDAAMAECDVECSRRLLARFLVTSTPRGAACWIGDWHSEVLATASAGAVAGAVAAGGMGHCSPPRPLSWFGAVGGSVATAKWWCVARSRHGPACCAAIGGPATPRPCRAAC